MKHLKKYTHQFDNNISLDKGDWISYNLNNKLIYNEEEIFGEILEIRILFNSYDDIVIDYIVSDLTNKNTHLINIKNIIRKLTDLEINSIKYNL